LPTNISEYQPALIGYDAIGQPVVIPVTELRVIADGRHDASDDQVQALANFVLERIDGKH